MISAPGHDYGEWTSNDDQTHQRVCSRNASHIEKEACADENKDHKCDICGKVLSECTDTNNDHNCDTCGKKLTDHTFTAEKTDEKYLKSAATCTEPKKCSCGAVEGKALGHDYKNGVCTRCNAKDPNYITPIAEKNGEWKFQCLDGGTLYSGSIYKSSGAYGISVGLGEALSLLPPEMQESQNTLEFCETYNGEIYYLGRGTGKELKSVTEDGKTVTVTDLDGNKLVLTRTGENTLKCTSASEKFTGTFGITVGLVFTFVAG